MNQPPWPPDRHPDRHAAPPPPQGTHPQGAPPQQATPQQGAPQQGTPPRRTPPHGGPQRSSTRGPVVALLAATAMLLFAGTLGAVATTVIRSGSATAGGPDTPALPEASTSPGSNPLLEESELESRSDTPNAEPPRNAENRTTGPTTARAPAAPVPALGDNPLNIAGNGAVNTPCDLPPFDTDPASQDAFYQAAVPCLQRMWAPALREAGLPTDAATVVTTASSVETPCGQREWNETAMYCSHNHTIYMTARYYPEIEGQQEPGVYLGQLAHEYGHAVQGMAGISEAYNKAVADAGGYDTAEGQALSRRSELQATCFGGMALAALQNGGLSNDHVFPALRDASNRGDEQGNEGRTHGSLASNEKWAERGFHANRITECNTWNAAEAAVR
ncbi:neutral zinc metallopeptidase [Salinifilum ghardaiensis]